MISTSTFSPLRIGKKSLSAWLFILSITSLLLISGCGQLDPVQEEPINKSYLQLLHNKERGSRNIEQLKRSDVLEMFAQKHAEWMAARGRLKHSDLDFGFNYRGENIAYNQRTEDEVTKSWMDSRGHRANILNSKFTHVGFGCARTKSGSLYWCACFGG